MCVSARLSPVPVIYPIPYLLCSQCVCLFAALPSKHTRPLCPLPTTSCHTHPKPPYVWSMFLEPLLCQQPTFCALAVGEFDLNLSPLCLPLDTVDNCRLQNINFHINPQGVRQKKHWHPNVAVVVLPSATINIAFLEIKKKTWNQSSFAIHDTLCDLEELSYFLQQICSPSRFV